MARLKLLALCIFFSTFCFSLWAKKVDVENAEKVVRHHIESKKHQFRDRSRIQLKYTSFKEHKQRQLRQQNALEADTVCYYVFNVNDDGYNGFVIVAGDDAAMPILGYSDNGSYDENNLPPAFAYWMECLQQEIMYAIENDLPQSEEAKLAWAGYLDADNSQSSWRANNVIVPPLIQTKWSQSAPYNGMCPQIEGGASQYAGRAPTGCVATAMAQLMKYYNHPARGAGQSQLYTTGSITVPAVNFEIDYPWNNMLNTYSGSSTTAEKEAIATLMFHCGASLKMGYTASGSGAPTAEVARALYKYFDYDASIQFKERLGYNNVAWHIGLKQQLDKKQPILYSGYNSFYGGHAFICDGYAANDYFHFNWGWGGSYDGYYLTNAMEPYGEMTFNGRQEIVVNIMPNQGGIPVPELRLYGALNASKTSVDKGEIFTVSSTAMNPGEAPFPGGLFGAALFDDDYNLVEIIGTVPAATMRSGDTNCWFGVTSSASFSITAAVSSEVEAGNYNLRTIAKAAGKNYWYVLEKCAIGQDQLNFEVKSGTISDQSNIGLFGTGSNPTFIITPDIITEGEPLSVQFGLRNTNSGIFVGEISLGLYDLGGNLMEIIEKQTVSLGLNGNMTFTFNTSQITSPGGNYIMTLYQKSASGETKKVGSYSPAYPNDMEVTVIGTSTDVTNNKPPVFQLYPNPVKQGEKLNITLPKELTGGVLSIYDANGSLKKQETLPATTIYNMGTSDLSSGIWMFHIVDKNGNGQGVKVICTDP